jgi:hypothetical protein
VTSLMLPWIKSLMAQSAPMMNEHSAIVPRPGGAEIPDSARTDAPVPAMLFTTLVPSRGTADPSRKGFLHLPCSGEG